jgi:lysophospholipase L1-like esterase
MKKIPGIVKNSLLVVVSIVMTIGLLEGVARILFRKQFDNPLEFRLSRPAPYANSEYFSEGFIRESFQQPGEWINPPGSRVILPGNFEGEYFHVRDHLRVTTDQPANAKFSVHVFGGSTIYSSEVPDRYTIPSFLQRLLNDFTGKRVKAINYGVTSVNTYQQLERLKTIKLSPGDVVVFYGGVNDGLLFTTGRVNGWIMGENYIEYERSNVNWLQKARFHLYQRLHQHSSFVENFLDPFSYQVPKHLRDSTGVESLKQQLKLSYARSLIETDSLCRKNQVTFINFIQPHILCRKPNTDYEKKLLRDKHIVPAPFISALELSYPSLLETGREISTTKKIRSCDLRNSLSDTREEFYLDYCHITEKGNKLVAGAIFDQIKNNFKK